MQQTILSLLLITVLTAPFSAGAESGNMKIGRENIRFTYIDDEGSTLLDCTHELINPDSQDWKVTCQDAALKVQKKYSVHLWITAYEHKSATRKQSYEILYWLLDNKSTSTGATVWFHLRDPSAVDAMDLSQQVDGGTAQLDLKFSPSPGVSK